MEYPPLTMNWAAGQSFHRCHADRNVPTDVNLKWIFTGEEVDRALRLWTNGYDIYLPQNTAVMHEYSGAGQRFWQYADGPLRRRTGHEAASDSRPSNQQEDQIQESKNSRERILKLLDFDPDA